MTVRLIPLEGLPEVQPGDDLAELLAPSLAANATSDSDVVAVTQKVVSKSEGRLVPAADRADRVARESVEVVARRGDLVIARTRHGFVCANAGVDASNVPVGLLSLLPEDPDASAERLQKELAARLGLGGLGIVITDTFGRPWREGVVDVAIGCAGLPALIDLRGSADDRGRPIETTVVAFADAVAAASGLVMTKAARVPAALVKGLEDVGGGAPPGSARDLVRAPADDLFRLSALTAVRTAGGRDTLSAGDVPEALLEEAVGAAAHHPDVSFAVLTSPAARRRLLAATAPADDDPARSAFALIVPCVAGDTTAAIEGGAAIGRLLVALRALGVASRWEADRPLDVDRVRSALALDDPTTPLGVVAVGPAAEGGA